MLGLRWGRRPVTQADRSHYTVSHPIAGHWHLLCDCAGSKWRFQKRQRLLIFRLRLWSGGTATTAEFTPPGELLTVTGMQIELSWNTASNLDLEVRDPVGGSLYWERPTVASGGQFGVNVNGACDALNSDTPSEQASWPGRGNPHRQL